MQECEGFRCSRNISLSPASVRACNFLSTDGNVAGLGNRVPSKRHTFGKVETSESEDDDGPSTLMGLSTFAFSLYSSSSVIDRQHELRKYEDLSQHWYQVSESGYILALCPRLACRNQE